MREEKMKNEVLDVLAHSLIEESAKKGIEARRSRQLLREESIDLENLWKLLPEEPKPFDLAEVQNETHLREMILERVLETAAHNITVSVRNGSSMPLSELPEDQQAEHLNKIILEVLDSDRGPGSILRQSIAFTILNYRMLDRLKALLPTLRSPSSKSKRVKRGIAYVEEQIQIGMFYFEAWTLFGDGTGHNQSDFAKQKLVEHFLKRETKI